MRVGQETPAVISGGASGLGAATARALAARGAQVALLDLDAEKGERLAAEIGGRFIETDVTGPESVRAALSQAAEAHGRARIAVTCAGIAPAARTVDREGRAHDAALFASVIAVNLLGTMTLASEAAAVMSGLAPIGRDGERGVVVMTASVAAFEGQIGQAAYAASKGGVAALVLPMARDLSKAGIRVMGIAPGLFRTPMLEGLPDEVQSSLGTQVPFPARLGDPAEFAALALHIVENPMLNGTTIRLDGAIRMTPK